MSPRSLRFGRLAFLAFLALYGVASLRTPEAGRLLDGVDLAIHETGHLVFAPFGDVLAALGGTLLQILFPAIFAAHFLWRGERYGAAVCLWWVAQNFWNVSVYVADARAQELPLVGGGEHDWAYLLGEAGWLSHDLALSRAFHATGVLIFLVALGLGLLATLATPGAAEQEPDPARAPLA